MNKEAALASQKQHLITASQSRPDFVYLCCGSVHWHRIRDDIESWVFEDAMESAEARESYPTFDTDDEESDTEVEMLPFAIFYDDLAEISS